MTNIYPGSTITISLRNANMKAVSVKGGWKYTLQGEITTEDFEHFRDMDLTGSLFEVLLECVEIGAKKEETPKGGPLAKWAGILCPDPEFWRWLNSAGDYGVASEADARSCVISVCGITSRAELDHNPLAGRIFREKFMAPFSAWKNLWPRSAPGVERSNRCF